MKNNLNEEYKNHEIFSELTRYIEFFFTPLSLKGKSKFFLLYY